MNEEKLGEVGIGWLIVLATRHPVLSSKTLVKYGTQRREWVTKENFTLMYNQTYDALIKYRIVIELEEDVF